MSVRTTIFYRNPNNGAGVVEHEPDTFIQTIETYLDEMASYVDDETGGVRELVIRVENNDNKYEGDLLCICCGTRFCGWEAVCWCEVGPRGLVVNVECPSCGDVKAENARPFDIEILSDNRD